MNDLNEKLKQFIMSEVNPDLHLESIEDDEPLIESGIVDSLGMLKILAFLEETFGIDLSSGEIRPELFQSVRTICQMVENSQSA
jgi:acyl carrier protein